MNYKHGKRKTRLYGIWANIKTRCYNAHDPHFDRYYKRGIKVCDEWLNDFEAFYDWSMNNGYKDTLTIDRINNDGNYEPSNCRWVSVKEQNQNKRNVILLTFENKTMSATAWSKSLRLGKNTVLARYHKGWSVEECLFGKKVV